MKTAFLFPLLFLFIFGCAKNLPHQNKPSTKLSTELKDHRFYLKMPTLENDTVYGYCDTGGGYTAIFRPTLRKIADKPPVREAKIKKRTINYIYAQDLFENTSLHPSIGSYYKSSIDAPFFEVPDESEEDEISFLDEHYEVFLGQFFFINKSWTFDYLKEELWVNTPIPEDKSKDNNIQSLGFRKNWKGDKKFGHPRMKITIDNELIDVLFDTGAIIMPKEDVDAGFKGKSAVGGSFIAKSIFEKWASKNPDWKIIRQGEIHGTDLIEVPEVTVGDLTAGPVWFATRPDEVWSEWMASSMDKVVKGAIGGSFLKYFKVTIDYNSELIQFEK